MKHEGMTGAVLYTRAAMNVIFSIRIFGCLTELYGNILSIAKLLEFSYILPLTWLLSL